MAGLQQLCALEQHNVAALIKTLDDIKSTISATSSSSVSCCIDPVLQLHNICQQSYHGGAFVGNHVHLALKSNVLEELTAGVEATVAARVPSLVPEAV